MGKGQVVKFRLYTWPLKAGLWCIVGLAMLGLCSGAGAKVVTWRWGFNIHSIILPWPKR